MAVSPEQNRIPNEPSLKDLLDQLKKDVFLNFNAHHIVKIQSFNTLTQTATATINYKKTFLMPNVAGVYVPRQVDYPTLLDCPVVVLGGGGGSLTFPITTGDDGIALFNDRDINNWFSGSSSSPVASNRLHAFSDAVILVGLRNLSSLIESYDSDAVALRYGATKLRLYADKILGEIGPTVTFEINATGKVKINNVTGEYTAALSQLFDDVSTALVSTALGPQLLQMPTFVADKLVFDSFKE